MELNGPHANFLGKKGRCTECTGSIPSAPPNQAWIVPKSGSMFARIRRREKITNLFMILGWSKNRVPPKPLFFRQKLSSSSALLHFQSHFSEPFPLASSGLKFRGSFAPPSLCWRAQGTAWLNRLGNRSKIKPGIFTRPVPWQRSDEHLGVQLP